MDQLHGRFEHLKEEAEEIIITVIIVFPLLLLYIHIVVVSLNIVPEQQVVLSLSLSLSLSTRNPIANLSLLCRTFSYSNGFQCFFAGFGDGFTCKAAMRTLPSVSER